MPARVTLPLVIPPHLADAAHLRSQLRAAVAAVEATIAAERRHTGARIVGRGAVRRQSWRSSPTTHVPHRVLRPRFATRNRWARIEAILRNRAFIDAYRAARARWLARDPTVLFPPGTFWLQHFANVQVAT